MGADAQTADQGPASTFADRRDRIHVRSRNWKPSISEPATRGGVHVRPFAGHVMRVPDRPTGGQGRSVATGTKQTKLLSAEATIPESADTKPRSRLPQAARSRLGTI